MQLDGILNAQKPLSPNHNEMLFIVQHLAHDDLQPAFKMLDLLLFPEIWWLRTGL